MTFGARDIIAIEEIAPDRFRGVRNLDNLTGAVFGGQQLALALASAQCTVPGWRVHALTGFFESRGVVDRPIELRVERTRDGRRFASRRVLATQGGDAIFDMIASFNADEPAPGYGERASIEDVPAPETLVGVREFSAAHPDRFAAWTRTIHGSPFPLELRLCDPDAAYFGEGTRAIDFWFRVPDGATVADAAGQDCLLACLSDYWLAGTASAPMRGASGPRIVGTVAINHAMWFHAPARTDEWLLFRTTGEWAGNARGLARGTILDRLGRRIASAVQEVAIRFAE